MKTSHGEDNGIEEDSRCIERLPVFAKVEVGSLEIIRGHGQPQECDETICCRRWDTSGGDEGIEGDLARKNGAKDHSPEDKHDCDRISRLSSMINLSYPMRHRENTITGNGEYKARGRDNCNTRALIEASVNIHRG